MSKTDSTTIKASATAEESAQVILDLSNPVRRERRRGFQPPWYTVFIYKCANGHETHVRANAFSGRNAVPGVGGVYCSQCNKITRAYIRHYSDNGQTTAYIEWSDGSRTEGEATGNGPGLHMRALFARAQREGIKIEHENW